jgi:6-phosphogluconolactonase
MRSGNLIQPPSRRTFLKAGALAGIACSMRGAYAFSPGSSARKFAYVGTDTRPVDGAANGKGIYVYEWDHKTGGLRLLKLAAETVSPSWICIHPSERYLYAVNEVSDYEGNSGSVSAFAIDRASGDLRFLNTVNSRGAGPTYISLDVASRYAFVANYYGGSIAVFPILENGRLGQAVFTHQDRGSLGSLHATSAPPGSFAISGHDAPHAHMIHSDPSNRFVLQTDLGQDRIYIYKFDSHTGNLTPADTPFYSLPSGDGPRHFVFHPNGRWMYSIQEEASTLVFFHYDPASGALAAMQTVSALPPGFNGTNFCSEVLISPDGLFLYAANRLHNSVAVFRIAKDGMLNREGEALTEGDYPNHVALDPSGKTMYVCNQRSDQITVFSRNEQTGMLAFTGQYLPLGTPMCMAFLD